MPIESAALPTSSLPLHDGEAGILEEHASGGRSSDILEKGSCEEDGPKKFHGVKVKFPGMASYIELPADDASKLSKACYFAKVFVDHAWTDLFICFMIMFSGVFMVCESHYEGLQNSYVVGESTRPADEIWADADAFFNWADLIFGAFFTCEVVVKLLALNHHLRQEPFWHTYDALIVILWVASRSQALNLVVNPMFLRLARLARLLRLMRIVRWVRFFDPLTLMVKSVVASLSALLWALVVLLLIMVITGMVVADCLIGFIRNGEGDPDARLEVYLSWGTVPRVIVTMFEITLGNWGPPCWLLTNNVNEGWSIFFLFYKCSIGFAVLQVIMSVFIQQTFKVASRDEELMIKEKHQSALTQIETLERLFDAVDISGDGFIDKEEFDHVLGDPRVKSWFAALELDVSDIVDIFQVMDYDGDGEISKEEFFNAVRTIKGPARRTDLYIISKMVSRMLQGICDIQATLPKSEAEPQSLSMEEHSGNECRVNEHV
eukprot:NODE_5539_length_1759_cov_7.841912.p1 GENE.NODE_5539_length_1759_cov_7.841912~~NODE_5539_length_1759_cov_7.841912.p1  ORF type:complete len:530 (+),score=140.62 NODE_5539_length_1759_cov_7.841912:120-1592(+)